MLRRDVPCDNCDGIGRWDVPHYGGFVQCEDCNGTGTRRERRADGLWIIVVAVTAIVVFALGTWFGMDVMAFNRSMVAVEGEPVPPCDDKYVVQKHDNPWRIASKCFPGEHTGTRATEITTLNGVNAGSLQIGQVLQLPERGGDRG